MAIVFVFISTLTFANSIPKPLNQYNLKCYGVANGLIQSSITDIALHQDGHLIISTYAGVVSFDGKNFSDYIPNSDNKFPKMEAWSLAVAQDGAIWVGTTTTGVYRFKDNEINHWDSSSGLTSNLINKVKIIGKDVYVFNDNHIFLYQPKGESSLIEIASPDNSVDIYHTFQGFDNELMVASKKGLWKRVAESWEYITVNYYNENYVDISAGITIDKDTVLLAYVNKIFQIKNGETTVFIPKLIRDKNVVVQSMMQDRQGDLWITLHGNGLLRYSARGLESAKYLPNEHITSIVQDDDGVMWFGTPAGLCSLNFDPIRSITKLNGLQNDFIRYVANGVDDSVYVVPFTYSSKLSYIKNDKVESIEIKSLNVENGEKILSMVMDNNNQIILATSNKIGKLSKNNEIEIIDEFISDKKSLVFDNDTLWYATRKKLYKYQNGVSKKILLETLKISRIYSISKSISSDLLLASHYSVYRIVDDVPLKVDIDLKFAFCAREFVMDELWICSEGLWLHFGNKNYKFGYDDGITEGHIHEVIEDDFGNIWVSTNSGLYRILRKNIDKVKNGEAVGEIFTKFDESYGMKSSEFNGSINGAVKTSDGRLWFAGQGGVTVVDPNLTLFKSDKIIKPIIEHIFVNGQVIPPKQWGMIAPKPQSIRLDFTAVFLSDAKSLSFRYKLTPYHDKWHHGYSASFPELSPGKYEIQLQVRHRQNKWSDSIKAHFSIQPAWNQTWWFRVISIIIIVIVLVGFPFWRIYRLKQKSIELNSLVAKQTESLLLANKKLDQLSRSDELTDIANRREFINSIKRLCSNPAHKMCLALIDIDDFKAYNDHYGHIAGDNCLVSMAKVLKSFSTDKCLVARFGGEEFVVLFDAIGLDEAKSIMQTLHESLEKENILHVKSSVKNILTLSSGLVSRVHGESVESIIDRADIVMYKAKAEGKNRLVIDSN